MNRDRTKELLPIIEAFADGSIIQARGVDDEDGEWVTLEDLLCLDECDYRIKPKPREWWIDLRTNDAFCNQEYAERNLNAGRSNVVHVREVE